jgi:hypothetical protein
MSEARIINHVTIFPADGSTPFDDRLVAVRGDTEEGSIVEVTLTDGRTIHGRVRRYGHYPGRAGGGFVGEPEYMQIDEILP